MKYLLMIFLIVGAGWYLYNLWATNTEIKNAKKDLWVITQDQNKVSDSEVNKEENKPEIVEQKDNTKPIYRVKKLDNKNYIKIDDLTKKVENISDKIKITWKVLNKQVDKIVVNFSNGTSDFPNDSYTLKTFKKWDSDFSYNADSIQFQNLDYGENKYLIEAYIWEDKSVLELVINIPETVWDEEETQEKLSEEISYDKKLIWEWDNALFIGLPESELFWKALSLDSWKITYSNIKDLEISKDDFDKAELTTENIWNIEWTWYLNKNIDSYVYWNTFREIDYSNKDSWVSFYILRKSGDKFIYEKMYFDFNHNLKWILKIEEFPVNLEESITDQMFKLNIELKEKNWDYEEVVKTDKLFKEIVR